MPIAPPVPPARGPSHDVANAAGQESRHKPTSAARPSASEQRTGGVEEPISKSQKSRRQRERPDRERELSAKIDGSPRSYTLDERSKSQSDRPTASAERNEAARGTKQANVEPENIQGSVLKPTQAERAHTPASRPRPSQDLTPDEPKPSLEDRVQRRLQTILAHLPPDPYKALGIPRDADGPTIKRTYRVLALQHHPNRNPTSADGHSEWHKVVQAYDILGDADRRARYDAQVKLAHLRAEALERGLETRPTYVREVSSESSLSSDDETKHPRTELHHRNAFSHEGGVKVEWPRRRSTATTPVRTETGRPPVRRQQSSGYRSRASSCESTHSRASIGRKDPAPRRRRLRRRRHAVSSTMNPTRKGPFFAIGTSSSEDSSSSEDDHNVYQGVQESKPGSVHKISTKKGSMFTIETSSGEDDHIDYAGMEDSSSFEDDHNDYERPPQRGRSRSVDEGTMLVDTRREAKNTISGSEPHTLHYNSTGLVFKCGDFEDAARLRPTRAAPTKRDQRRSTTSTSFSHIVSHWKLMMVLQKMRDQERLASTVSTWRSVTDDAHESKVEANSSEKVVAANRISEWWLGVRRVRYLRKKYVMKWKSHMVKQEPQIEHPDDHGRRRLAGLDVNEPMSPTPLPSEEADVVVWHRDEPPSTSDPQPERDARYKASQPVARHGKAFYDIGNWLRREGILAQLDLKIVQAYAWVLRFLRAKPLPGLARIEWTCSCGKAMYGDYDADDSEMLTSLKASLNKAGHSDVTKWSALPILFALAEVLLLAAIAERVADFTIPVVDRIISTVLYHELAGALCTLGNSGNSSIPTAWTAGQAPANGSVPPPSPQQARSGQPSIPPAPGSVQQQQQNQAPAQGVVSTAQAAEFFELCVNRNKFLVSLGEIRLRDDAGNAVVESDFDLFAQIYEMYHSLRGRYLRNLLYRPTDIQFVRFGVRQGGRQTGIYQTDSIPPIDEVRLGRWLYRECPMDPLPPMDTRTFFHYFWKHADHPVSSEKTFYDRLPKKLVTSMLRQATGGTLNLGWGVHIIEGPNKPLIAWLVTGVVTVSFIVALVYDILRKNPDSGFGIGQWLVAVLSTILTALYFHVQDEV